MGLSHESEHALRTIFKRCVQCPPQTPTCPTCPAGEICSLVPKDCFTCAHMKCIPDPSPRPHSHGPNIGAIAGGVVGGVALVAIIVFCIWRFWIKKRREQQDQELEEEWTNGDLADQKRSQYFGNVQDEAASTRTRGSLANSILSRASNIIQIAYIPGVTNRNGGSGHTSIHAPVPPVPAAHRQNQPPKSPLSNEGDALFFGIGDLRDSTYSASSSLRSAGNRDTRYTAGNRDTQYTMKSISPSLMRDSVASDVQWDDASTTPMPAQSVARLAPRMVSVKSSLSAGSSSLGSTESRSETSTPTPPDPTTTTTDKPKTVPVMVPGQGSSLSPSSSIRAKATQVTVSKNARGRFPVSRQASNASTLTAGTSKHIPAISSPLAEQTEEEATTTATSSPTPTPNSGYTTPPAIQPAESPFFDASELLPAGSPSRPGQPNPYASMASTVGVGTSLGDVPKRGGKGMGGLSAVIEGSERGSRAASTRTRDSGGSRDASPFSDVHEVVGG